MDIITKYIYERILEASDLELQRKIWLNENNDTGLMSSYVELMCSLFDDFNFDDFIDNRASTIGLSNTAIFELNKLRELLNSYVEKESDEEIINDPEWEKIVEQAKVVIEKWDKVQNAAKTTGKFKFPGNNPAKAPKGFEWKGQPGSKPGSKDGNWYNPKTGESLRPDLNHPNPIGLHWDYKDSSGKWWRIFSDGNNVPK